MIKKSNIFIFILSTIASFSQEIVNIGEENYSIEILNNNVNKLKAAEVEQQKASSTVVQQQTYLANSQALQQLPEKLPLCCD